MEKSFREEIKVESLAHKVLCGIINSLYYPPYLTQYHKEAQEYSTEFTKEFEESLNKDQKKDFRTLEEINNSVSATENIYQLLYGMRIKVALDELINNPLKILEIYDGKAKDIRLQYKSVKQLKEEKDNEWF